VLPGISVQAVDSAGGTKSTTTNNAGAYSMTGIASGNATITASATSYQTASKSVAVSSDVRVDFVLARTPPPQGKLSFSTTANRGWTSIDVSVNGQFLGTLRRFFEPNDAPSSCDAVADARLVTTLAPGTATWTARSDRGGSWSGSSQVTANGCLEILLTCSNRDCSGTPPPAPPPPTPTPPPPTPGPIPSSGYFVWGGTNYGQYLGFFTCIFCQEFGSESINNQFGSYGSPFSATSIRNQFSQYGSQFSADSACNQFATHPPKVYNSNRTVYYGELTLNQFRVDAIKTSSIVSWLQGDVCRH
jgi:hypothetical protein